MENRRNKVKPYPLKWKLLVTIKDFNTADLKGLTKAVEGNYSIHTVRKALRQLEKDEFIRSTRDENKNKIYALSGLGVNYINKIRLKTFGYEEHEINNILLHWSLSIDCENVRTKDFPEKLKDLSGLASNKEKEIFGLIIEKNGETLSELKKRIERIIEILGEVTKMYYFSYKPDIEEKMPTEINGTKTERFKIE